MLGVDLEIGKIPDDPENVVVEDTQIKKMEEYFELIKKCRLRRSRWGPPFDNNLPLPLKFRPTTQLDARRLLGEELFEMAETFELKKEKKKTGMVIFNWKRPQGNVHYNSKDNPWTRKRTRPKKLSAGVKGRKIFSSVENIIPKKKKRKENKDIFKFIKLFNKCI